MKRKSWFLFAASLLVSLLVMAGAGCQPPEVRQAIKTARDQATVEKAKVQTQAAVAAAKVEADQAKRDAAAKANPLDHPLDHANVVVKKAEKPLGMAATTCFTLAIASCALWFVPWLHWLTKVLVPGFLLAAGCSYAALIALPFAPYFVYGGIALAIALAVFEFVRFRPQIEQAVENKLGTKPPTPAPVPQPVQIVHQ